MPPSGEYRSAHGLTLRGKYGPYFLNCLTSRSITDTTTMLLWHY